MAFSTLDAVRTGQLNVALGLDGDSDDRFGTDDLRNLALQDAIRRMWPSMARLTRESITIVQDQIDYTLTTLRDVEALEYATTDTLTYTNLSGNWTSWWDEEDATPVVRLRLAAPLDPDWTLRAIGYVPYSVPTSSPPSSSGSLDLQPEDEWIVVAGALAYLYRRQLNQFMTYERHENENRKTFLSPGEMLTMYRDAESAYQAALNSRRRRLVRPVKATPSR